MNKKRLNKSIQSAFNAGLGAAAFIATLPVAHAQAQAGLEEVIVTARKRDEGSQSVPVSIAALSAEVMAQRNVQEVQDLNTVVPGFRFGSQGGKGNSDVILRGLSKIPLGDGIPSVVTYVNNVALPARGSNVPTYDIANIQVLKGPQGTLFGRNSLGGAVLMTSVAPSYEFGGYLKGGYGTKDYRDVEGAVNVPIVDQKLAIRIAGQLRRQDGLAKNLSGGPDFDNTHQNSYRISLLWNPTDSIESTTVYDHFEADEVSAPSLLYRVDHEKFAAFNLQQPGFGDFLDAAVTDYYNRGKAAGIHAAFSDLPYGGYVKRNLWGISNDTSWNAGVATVRNIFGYRRVSVSESIDTGATGPIPVAPGVDFVMFDAAQDVEREFWSDEFQLFGNALDDRLDWIVGLFYNKDQGVDPEGTNFTAFSVSGPAPAVTSHVRNENQAVFGQLGFDLSEWTVEGLKLNAGLRYSEDKVWACGGSNGTSSYMTVGECAALADTGNTTDGIGIIKNSGEALSWTVGLDWRLSPDTLTYLTSRRGYRGVNVNTPLFETVYTTGVGTNPTTGLPNPDLRPFQKTDEETLTDVELGVKNDWSIGDVKGRINVAAYYSKYKGALQFINHQGDVYGGAPDAPNSGSVGVNAADLTIQGVEADLTVIPVPSLTLTLSGAYTDQTVDKLTAQAIEGGLTKDQITLPSPKFSGTFAFSWTLPAHPLNGDLVLNGDYYHTDKFSGQGGENLPGYDLANFRLAWNGISNSGLDLAVYVKNAFDEDYYQSPVALNQEFFPVSVVTPGNPRTWGVEASYKF